MKVILFIFIFVFSYAKSGEYIFGEIKPIKTSLDIYLDKLYVPNIYYTFKNEIKNDEGKILRNGLIDVLAKARYFNKAYLYYYDYDSHEYFLIDNENKSYSTPTDIDVEGYEKMAYNRLLGIKKSIASIITSHRNLLQVSKNAVYINGKKLCKTPAKIDYAKFQNNPNGYISLIVVSGNDIYITNDFHSWIKSNIHLASKGDRENILSIYPIDKNVSYYAIYKYVNSINKGIVAGKVDFKDKKDISGWVFNSENRNLSNPSIYVTKNNIVIGTNNNISIFIDKDKFENITKTKPLHIQGLEEDIDLSFILGTGVSYLFWYADNKVEDDNENKYGSVDYSIND